MIQKAIVESIENDYQIKVRIPKYDKLSIDGFSYDELSTSIICATPGTLVNYSVGDIVLVGFENDEISKPVVLGLLYTKDNSGESIAFPEISSKLDSISDLLHQLKTVGSYIHIKYSNDGGVTFTSLYDYSEEEYDPTTNMYSATNIEIDPKSTYIMWNAVSNSGASLLKNIHVTTIVTAQFINEVQEIVSEETLINLPTTFNYAQNIVVSYKLSILTGDKSNYNISLFTDRNDLGSVEGDYIGFYYSTNQLASNSPVDYSWASIKVRIQKFINDAYNDLLTRVQANERYLYGQAKEDTVNTEAGLNSAIQVYKDELNVANKQNVILSADKKLSINTQDNYFSIGNFRIAFTNDNHLRVYVPNLPKYKSIYNYDNSSTLPSAIRNTLPLSNVLYATGETITPITPVATQLTLVTKIERTEETPAREETALWEFETWVPEVGIVAESNIIFTGYWAAMQISYNTDDTIEDGVEIKAYSHFTIQGLQNTTLTDLDAELNVTDISMSLSENVVTIDYDNLPQHYWDIGEANLILTVSATPIITVSTPTSPDSLVQNISFTKTLEFNPEITCTISSDVLESSVVVPGDIITYTITAVNTGTVTISGLTIYDTTPDTQIDAFSESTIVPGESSIAILTYMVTQEDAETGRVNFTAYISGIDPKGNTVTAQASREDPALVPVSAITVTKSANPITDILVGDTIHYTVIITNTGNVPITIQSVDDDLVSLSVNSFNLLPNASHTETYENSADYGETINTVTVSGATNYETISKTANCKINAGMGIVKSSNYVDYTPPISDSINGLLDSNYNMQFNAYTAFTQWELLSTTPYLYIRLSGEDELIRWDETQEITQTFYRCMEIALQSNNTIIRPISLVYPFMHVGDDDSGVLGEEYPYIISFTKNQNSNDTILNLSPGTPSDVANISPYRGCIVRTNVYVSANGADNFGGVLDKDGKFTFDITPLCTAWETNTLYNCAELEIEYLPWEDAEQFMEQIYTSIKQRVDQSEIYIFNEITHDDTIFWLKLYVPEESNLATFTLFNSEICQHDNYKTTEIEYCLVEGYMCGCGDYQHYRVCPDCGKIYVDEPDGPQDYMICDDCGETLNDWEPVINKWLPANALDELLASPNVSKLYDSTNYKNIYNRE